MTPTRIRPGITAGACRLGALAVIAVALLLFGSSAASAHVVPWTTIQLNIENSHIEADLDIPLDDLEAATGLDLGDETQTEVNAHAQQITAYLVAHFAPTTDQGEPWTVSGGSLTVLKAGDPSTTGLYQQLSTTMTLTPPAGDDGRSFNLGYTAVVEKVITHVVVVTVGSDWAAGHLGATYELGTIALDTVFNTVPGFHVDLDHGSELRGFTSMLLLGVQHIEQGTDHQLFLLALLIPAPLFAVGRRWRTPATTRQAVRRIGGITLSFTLGHSVTLALGALGLPVPQRPVEALIAVSILVAAAHAIRPIFPGREVLVSGSFGLVHGLAFSESLRELHLSGSRLVLSLLGFNLGIEAMQLVVVGLVLPPLILLARAHRYQWLRLGAATLAGVAALGWLAARLGFPNPMAWAADRLSGVSLPIVAALWISAALVVVLTRRRVVPVGGTALPPAVPASRASAREPRPGRRGDRREQVDQVAVRVTQQQ